MNEMAMVEYLLKIYAKYDRVEGADGYERMYYGAKADLAYTIIQEHFGMQIEETDTEYRAYNSVCSVSVKK